MSSEKPSGADNQQERPGIEQWIVGFVDGEGCFSCPIQRNVQMTLGWQCQPRFAVVQGERSIRSLELIRDFFDCGKVYRNRRQDNHREDLLVYNVWRLRDLLDRIVPFFEANPLVTAKQRRVREVLNDPADDGETDASDARRFKANRVDPADDEPSEAVSFLGILRGHTPANSSRRKELKIWSRLHGDMKKPRSEIPCRVSSDLHEWRNDLGAVSTGDSAKLQYE